uniref:Uncharacterized protein n=1 Tax=Sphaerodactylus townsendi TaxID=933632 RepID=A0ACB8FJQ3_9SAUR
MKHRATAHTALSPPAHRASEELLMCSLLQPNLHTTLCSGLDLPPHSKAADCSVLTLPACQGPKEQQKSQAANTAEAMVSISKKDSPSLLPPLL